MYTAIRIAVLSFAITGMGLYSSEKFEEIFSADLDAELNHYEFHLTNPSDPADFIDLEENAQDFVLESKQIFMQEYPTAFNPTIVRWKGALLMAFMIRQKKTGVVNGIGMVWLDNNFEVDSPVYELEVFCCPSEEPAKQMDPRLIAIEDRLYVVYNSVISREISNEQRRMFVAEVHFDGIHFYTDMPEGLLNFEGEKESRWEKNWMPFDYNGELHFVYSLTPHKILKPVLGRNFCESVASSKGNIDWKWGYPHGGTQAYSDGDKYLGFFHSSIKISTVHSNGKNFPHYFFGAYTFSLHPPFAITHISPEPIMGKGFYSGPPYKTWRPLRVVFPDGYVFDEKFIWILCGKQDHEIWAVKLDRKGLLDSLVPVAPK